MVIRRAEGCHQIFGLVLSLSRIPEPLHPLHLIIQRSTTTLEPLHLGSQPLKCGFEVGNNLAQFIQAI